MNDCPNCRHFEPVASLLLSSVLRPLFGNAGTCTRPGRSDNARTTIGAPTRISALSSPVSDGMTCDGFEEVQHARSA